MPGIESDPADSALKHLDGKNFESVLIWLEQALRGQEPLPMVVPGESPEDSILRHERILMTITRGDLREACRRLVRRFIRKPRENDSFVTALLRLAKGFELLDVASDLHVFASDDEQFSVLSLTQQHVVLSTLLDLRAPLPALFWHQLAARDREKFGVISFSGLLRQSPLAAFQILPLLPNDENIADEIYVILSQQVQLLKDVERDELVTKVRVEVEKTQPHIQSALKEWAHEQPPAQHQEVISKNWGPLDRALKSRNESYRPRPRSARLLEPCQPPPQ